MIHLEDVTAELVENDEAVEESEAKVKKEKLNENDNEPVSHVPRLKRKYQHLPLHELGLEREYHRGDTQFKCKRCVQRCFNSHEELSLHARLHLPGRELGFQCDLCTYKTESWGRMLHHILTHDSYVDILKGE